MSTGKRLAKRSIIGTRVCAPGDDGQFYSGVIQAVKSSGDEANLYSVRFETDRRIREFKETELIGPGFQTMSGLTLQPGQKVFLTYNGRETAGFVTAHLPQEDELTIRLQPPGHEEELVVRKRLEDVRLLESRKSLRLMDQDTDFARLADMAGDRKRASSGSIDVPGHHGSRKRRQELDCMDECTAALVLMSLSCSPAGRLSPSPGSDALSWRSGTPSPPLSDAGNSTSVFWAHLATDEGIVIDDFEDVPKRKKTSRLVFRCTWPGCVMVTATCAAIETHVRNAHLGPRDPNDDEEFSDHEEEFYYTEVELGLHTSSPPTLSHRDMARPPHEDPEYQKQLKNVMLNNHQKARPINIPNGNVTWSSVASSPSSPQKQVKLSISAPNRLVSSPTRKVRGDTKKCRKVYGMEHRDLWCTQCKWKKACTRFGD